MGFQLAKCPNGHYFDRSVFKECPQCGTSPLSNDKKEMPTVQTLYGPPVISEEGAPAEKKEPLLLQIAKCANGHYYNKVKTSECPVCGSGESKVNKKAEAEERVRLCERIDEADTAILYYKEQIEVLKKRICELQIERIKHMEKAGG